MHGAYERRGGAGHRRADVREHPPPNGRARGAEPADEGVVVVGPRVGHRAPRIFVGQVEARARAPVETELQDAHAGQLEAVAQIVHLPGDPAEVLGDQRQSLPAEPGAQGLEDLGARRPLETSPSGGARARRDEPAAVKADEVIEPDRVEALQGGEQPASPPVEVGAAVGRPAVHRISPELTVARESVRRSAGERGAIPGAVEAKQILVRPGVDAVVGHEHRHVAEQPDSLVLTSAPKRREVSCKALLDEHVKRDLVREVAPRSRQGGALAKPELSVPVGPARAAGRLGQRAEERMVLEPASVCFAEARQLTGQTREPSPSGALEGLA